MDDRVADQAGIPRVDATALLHARAAEFKDQVQGALLRRIHDLGGHLALRSVELRGSAAGVVEAHLFGMLGPVAVLSGRSPKEVADAIYSWAGGTVPTE